MRDADAFQLGYLPHLIAAQFDALTLVTGAREGASDDLLKRVDAMTAALPMRGPEVVSCMWQVTRVLAENGATAPTEPTSLAEVKAIMNAARAAVPMPSSTYEHAMRCGAAERAIDNAVRLAVLLPVAPTNPTLQAALVDVLREVARLLTEDPATDCPTTKLEAAMLTVALERAKRTLEAPVRPEMFIELATSKAHIATCARSLESVAWGTPREAIRAWFEKWMTGNELVRRVAEHYRWNLLVRTLPGGDAAPRTISNGDSTAMFAFSDRVALDGKPAYLASDREDEKQVLTVAGALMLRSIPDDVDVLVLDAGDDPAKTINYRRAQTIIGQVASDVAFELAACNWSQLDLAVLRAHSYWVLVANSSLQVPLASDGHGRQLPAVYSTADALDAYLASLTPEQREQYAGSQRLVLAGHALFPTLAQGANGFILNPTGPARSRLFNRTTLEQLATPPAPAPST